MVYLNKEIGMRIARLRKSHGMTQENLAERLNCSIKHISHVERGVASLSLDLLVETAALFNCSLDYLILGKDHTPEALLPSLVSQILSSNDPELASEKELLLSYLKMYEKLRGDKMNPYPGRSDSGRS